MSRPFQIISYAWISFLLLTSWSFAETRNEAYVRELQEIQQKAQACGPDMGCYNRALQEMDALTRKHFGPGPSAADPKRTMETAAAGKAESKHADSPCYDILSEKTYIKQTSGYAIDHIDCVPALAQLTWTIEEVEHHLWRPAGTDMVRYTVKESYPVAIGLVYASPARGKLKGYSIYGPAPIGLYGAVKPPESRIDASMAKINGRITLAPIRAGPLQQIAITSPTDVRIVKKDDYRKGGVSIRAHEGLMEGMPELDYKEIIISSSSIHFNRDKWAHIGYPDSVILQSGPYIDSGGISVSEVAAALRSGVLNKTLPVEKPLHHENLKTTGTLALRLTLRPKPGYLVVTPKDGLTAIGPDKQGRFSPSKKNYQLKNPGISPIQFQVSKQKNWLSLSTASGSLEPSQSQTVTVSINEQATRLKKSDTDRVSFVNKTNGKGNTHRTVKVGAEQRWRVLVDGWDTVYFGSNLLAGGLSVKWRITADFAVTDKTFRGISGTATFTTLKSHSNPPGVYDCDPTARAIKQPAFPVIGQKKGDSVVIDLPANSYKVSYYCVMDTDHARDVFDNPKKYGMDSEARVRGAAKLKASRDWRTLPQGRKTIPLKNNWRNEIPNTTSMDAHSISIIRLP